jgi:hypothetical protein
MKKMLLVFFKKREKNLPVIHWQLFKAMDPKRPKRPDTLLSASAYAAELCISLKYFGVKIFLCKLKFA